MTAPASLSSMADTSFSTMADTSYSAMADTTQSTIGLDAADDAKRRAMNGAVRPRRGTGAAAPLTNGSLHRHAPEVPNSTTTSASTSAAAVASTASFNTMAATSGVDAFDAIVQAANPAHPDHAVWQERFGGSLRSTRKSVDGLHAEHASVLPSALSSAGSAPSASHSIRRNRSKSHSKASNPSMRARPSLDSSARPHTIKHRELDDESTPLGMQSGTSSGIAPRRRNQSAQSQARTAPQSQVDDIVDVASGTKTPTQDDDERAARRRRRRREKGKAKAAPPPVPPPRTTSYAAAYLEPPLGSPSSSMQEDSHLADGSALASNDDRGRVVIDGTASAPLQYVSTFPTFHASAPSSPAYATYSNDVYLQLPPQGNASAALRDTGSPSRAPIVLNGGHYIRQGTEDRLVSVGERSNAVPMLPSPSTASSSSSNVPPARQSSKPTNYATTTKLRRPNNPLASITLPGRRSIDFRMPDDDVAKMRAEAIATAPQSRAPRRGLDAIFSSFRSRRPTEQSNNILPPSFDDATKSSQTRMPPPILRTTAAAVASASRPSASVETAERPSISMSRGHSATPPIPPPRSPLRAKMALRPEAAVVNPPADTPTSTAQDDTSQTQKEKARKTLAEDVTERAATPNAAFVATDRDVILAAPDSTKDDNKPIDILLEREAKLRGRDAVSVFPSHTRNISIDSEGAGEEFHDALSDEGGNGSSADEGVGIRHNGGSTSATKRRRQRHKSSDGAAINDARKLEEIGSTEVVPLPSTNITSDNMPRRDSSASEDDIGVLPASPARSKLKKKSIRNLAAATSATNDLHTMQDNLVNDPSMTTVAQNQPELLADATVDRSVTPAMSYQTALGDSASTDPLYRQVTGLPATYSHESSLSSKQLPSVPRSTSSQVGLSSRRIPPPPISPRMAAEGAASAGAGKAPSSTDQPSLQSIATQSSRSLSENYRAGNGASASTPPQHDDKALPNPPTMTREGIKRYVTHQRSFSRTGSGSGSAGGMMSGVFARMRRDRTPSHSQLSPKGSGEALTASGTLTKLPGSQTHLPPLPSTAASSIADHSLNIGLGIETASNNSGEQRRGSPQPVPEIRGSGGGSSSISGWRNRIPSFSNTKASKILQAEAQRSTTTSPPPLPVASAPIDDETHRRTLLHAALSHSLSEQHLASAPVPSHSAATVVEPTSVSPTTIHKTLSPALLTQMKHEADEVGSFIGSDGAEEELSADSKRGTWSSMQGFELPPDQVYEEARHASAARAAASPSVQMQVGDEEMRSLHGPKRFPSSDGKHLSMTTRRLTRHSSASKLTAPRALDLTSSNLSPTRIVTAPTTAPAAPSDGRFDDCDEDDGMGRLPMSAKVQPSPLAFPGHVGSPTSAASAALNSPTSISTESPRRMRNQSMGSTLLSGVASKPRSSFAMDRDRSPVVHQAWADLPPSPAPTKSSGMKKFFSSGGSSGTGETKSPLLRNKQRTASSNALRSSPASGRPSFGDLFRPSMDLRDGGGGGGGLPRRAIDRLFSSPPASTAVDELVSPSTSAIDSPPPGHDASLHTMTSTSSSSHSHRLPLSSSVSHDYISGATAQSATPRTPTAGVSAGGMSRCASSMTTDTGFDVQQQQQQGQGQGQQNGSVRSVGASTPSFSSMSFSASTSNQHHRFGAITPSASSTSTAHSGGAQSELDAFGRMLRDRAKEDAQRLREIAQRSATVQPSTSARSPPSASSSPSPSRALATPPPTTNTTTTTTTNP